MRSFAIPLFGLLAAGALIVADLNPVVKVMELNSLVRFPQTTWGGGGRLWFCAGLMIIATLLWACNRSRLPILCAGICLGLQIDIVLSALGWKAAELARLEPLLGDFEPTLQWRLGAFAYAAAALCVIAFFINSAYPVRPPALRKEQ
jgi:hypothetical protein